MIIHFVSNNNNFMTCNTYNNNNNNISNNTTNNIHNNYIQSQIFSTMPLTQPRDDTDMSIQDTSAPHISTTKSTAARRRKVEIDAITDATNTASLQKPLTLKQDLEFCYKILKDVSRSFAMVIQQLPQEMRDSVCIFYLVLRALDTVEDEMDDHDSYQKQSLLTNFYKILDGNDSKKKQFEFFEWAPWCQQSTFENILNKLVTVHMGSNVHAQQTNISMSRGDKNCNIAAANGVHKNGLENNGITNGIRNGVNAMIKNGMNKIEAKLDAKYESNKALLKNFEAVLNVFHYVLNESEREVIQSITKEMGHGMSEFTKKLSINSVDIDDSNNKCKVEEFDELNDYCYYVAGCVGLGLSQLFALSKYVDSSFAKQQFHNRYVWFAIFIFNVILRRLFAIFFLFCLLAIAKHRWLYCL